MVEVEGTRRMGWRRSFLDELLSTIKKKKLKHTTGPNGAHKTERDHFGTKNVYINTAELNPNPNDAGILLRKWLILFEIKRVRRVWITYGRRFEQQQKKTEQNICIMYIILYVSCVCM